ncbi:MAG: pyridoxal phosphate-dependent class II aminotransferase [Paludibacteraceae bacterium]|nr:pyridoxal phosphate-dependent class II aminotransferase [Paludibacteraceae bacterium]
MIKGHGDDIYDYSNISSNFSANTYNHFCHDGLYKFLSEQLPTIANYPEADASSLEQDLSLQLGINRDELMVTNGATEAIYLIAQAFSHSNSAIVGPTFSEYGDACQMHHHNVRYLTDLQQVTNDLQMVWLCNPNNPTGRVTPLEQLEKVILANSQTFFIIDSSYAPFTNLPLPSCREAAKYKNVLLLHSMTKRFAIPGLRLGFITGNRVLLSKIKSQRMPWSVNQMAICAGKYLLKNQHQYNINLLELFNEVKYLSKALADTRFLEVQPTDCHFMLVACRCGSAKELKEFLATRHGILIRDASNFWGLDDSFFRVAVQSHSENVNLVKGIEQWKNSL